MNLKKLSAVMLVTIIGIAGFSATAEARCHKNVNVSVGGCGPCCYQPVYAQPVYVQPVYAQPVYAAPMYVPPPAYAVPCEPCCYPAQPACYSNFSFGLSWR